MRTISASAIYSIIGGLVVSSIFPLLVFSRNYFILFCTEILDLGDWSFNFWGIVFPLFLVLLFWHSGQKINSGAKQISYFKACIQFSFRVISKLIITLLVLYLIEKLINRVSIALDEIKYEIIFILGVIAILSFILFILTFLISLLIIKLSLKPQPLN
jgi:hypothetical protein